MQFIEKSYENGKEINREITMPNLQAAKNWLHATFQLNHDAAIYEEVKQANGGFTIAVKDRGNKIIIQLKTKENPIPCKSN